MLAIADLSFWSTHLPAQYGIRQALRPEAVITFLSFTKPPVRNLGESTSLSRLFQLLNHTTMPKRPLIVEEHLAVPMVVFRRPCHPAPKAFFS